MEDNKLKTNAKTGQRVEVVNAAGEFDRTGTILGVRHDVLIEFKGGASNIWVPANEVNTLSDEEADRRDREFEEAKGRKTKDLLAVDDDTKFDSDAPTHTAPVLKANDKNDYHNDDPDRGKNLNPKSPQAMSTR